MNIKRHDRKTTKSENELILLSFKVTKKLKDAFKAKVASQGKKMGPVIKQFMQGYIKK
ncbi:MAG: hypothetical protein V4471_02705 [Pseudomonadota bacterium]